MYNVNRFFCVSLFTFFSMILLGLGGCNKVTQNAAKPNKQETSLAPEYEVSVSQSVFGKLPDGTDVEEYKITNTSGAEVRVINYGGIVTAIRVSDRNGKIDDVVLGYDSFDPYIKNPTFFGAIIGRYANRIAKGKFPIEGETYKLAINNKPNTLHGGMRGFDKVVWQGETFHKDDVAGVVLTYVSPAGEEGYPGTLTMRATYTFNKKNELSIDYEATTDRTTVVNFTNHSYFNLGGINAGNILSHQLKINADRYTSTDSTGIPLGNLASVAGSSLDFRQATAIGRRIEEEYKSGLGYDHNFVVNRGESDNGKALVLAARVEEPTTGRILEVQTTEPGIQLYTANHMDGTLVGKGGQLYKKHAAFCLETQHFPDSPNRPEFPTTILKPGDKFHSKTIYAFSAK